MANQGFIDMEYIWKEKGGKYISMISMKASNKNSQLLRDLLKRKG